LGSDLLEYGCFYNLRQIHTYGEEYHYVKDMLILAEGLYISLLMFLLSPLGSMHGGECF